MPQIVLLPPWSSVLVSGASLVTTTNFLPEQPSPVAEQTRAPLTLYMCLIHYCPPLPITLSPHPLTPAAPWEMVFLMEVDKDNKEKNSGKDLWVAPCQVLLADNAPLDSHLGYGADRPWPVEPSGI